MKKLLMVDSASEAGDDNRARASAKHTIGEEAEAGTWWLEVLSGTPEEPARLAPFISEGCSLVRELPSGPVVVQLLKLVPTERKQFLPSDCESHLPVPGRRRQSGHL